MFFFETLNTVLGQAPTRAEEEAGGGECGSCPRKRVQAQAHPQVLAQYTSLWPRMAVIESTYS
jgi:hypothetical protein